MLLVPWIRRPGALPVLHMSDPSAIGVSRYGCRATRSPYDSARMPPVSREMIVWPYTMSRTVAVYFCSSFSRFCVTDAIVAGHGGGRTRAISGSMPGQGSVDGREHASSRVRLEATRRAMIPMATSMIHPCLPSMVSSRFPESRPTPCASISGHGGMRDRRGLHVIVDGAGPVATVGEDIRCACWCRGVGRGRRAKRSSTGPSVHCLQLDKPATRGR